MHGQRVHADVGRLQRDRACWFLFERLHGLDLDDGWKSVHVWTAVPVERLRAYGYLVWHGGHITIIGDEVRPSL